MKLKDNLLRHLRSEAQNRYMGDEGPALGNMAEKNKIAEKISSKYTKLIEKLSIRRGTA